MAADYETVAATFKSSDPVVVAEVNADNHKDLASRFGVRSNTTTAICSLLLPIVFYSLLELLPLLS